MKSPTKTRLRPPIQIHDPPAMHANKDLTHALCGAALAVSALIGLASCDKNRPEKMPEAPVTSGPAGESPKPQPAISSADLRQKIRDSQVTTAETNAALRDEFAAVLEAHGGDAEQAIEAWLKSYLDGVEPMKAEAMANALLRAIQTLAFEAGGQYIENNFKSAQSRRQALANWFRQGAILKHKDLATLFRAIKDPADSELYARTIASVARTERARSFSDSLAWLKNQIGDAYYGEAVNEFLDGGRIVPRTPADRKVLEDLLADAKGLPEKTRASAAEAWASSAAPGYLKSAAEFLQQHGINPDGVWTKIIAQSGAKDMNSFVQLRDMLPENAPKARAAIAASVVSNLGVTAESLAFLTPGRDDSATEVGPYVESILKSESYGDMAGLLENMGNQAVRTDLTWQVLEWGIMGGKSPAELEPFSRLTSDPARLNLLLRKAEIIRRTKQPPAQP